MNKSTEILECHYFDEADLSRRWKYPLEYIEDLFLKGELQVSVVFDCHVKLQPIQKNRKGFIVKNNAVWKIGMFDIHSFESNMEGGVGDFIASAYHFMFDEECILKDKDGLFYKANNDDVEPSLVMVLADEVYRYEKDNNMKIYDSNGPHQYPERIKEEVELKEVESKIILPSAIPPYLDKTREDCSQELVIAIEAWLYVVELGPIPPKFKKELREFLRIKGYKGEALERIATVANPYKDKGTPRRSE